MIASIIAGILIAYSLVKTVWIAKSKTDSKLLGYDIFVFNDKEAREFSNLITNLLTTLTFLYGTTLYVANIYTDYGLIIGIALLILVIVQDIYFIKVFLPKEYNRMRGN